MTASVGTYTVSDFSCSVGPVTFSNINVAPVTSGSGTVTLSNFSPFTTVVDGQTQYGLDLTYSSNTGFSGGEADVAWTYDVSSTPTMPLDDAYAELTGGSHGASALIALNETLSNGKTLSLTGGGTTSITFDRIDMLHAAKDQQNMASPGSAAFTSVMGNGFSTDVIPEPSTWAMMLLGFVGLGFLGYRQTQKGQGATA
jgi:hypothetical protein